MQLLKHHPSDPDLVRLEHTLVSHHGFDAIPFSRPLSSAKWWACREKVHSWRGFTWPRAHLIVWTLVATGILLTALVSFTERVWIDIEAEDRSVEKPFKHLRHLVLVAGHSVYLGTDFKRAGNQQSWALEPYQQVEGQVQTLLDHMELGVREAAADPDALLLFSGGQTRQASGPRSEGTSYWLVADAMQWFGYENVRERAGTEEHARDSFENLLFSLCRFFELTGHYPQQVTVVTYDFKCPRFKNLHRHAIAYPEDTAVIMSAANVQNYVEHYARCFPATGVEKGAGFLCGSLNPQSAFYCVGTISPNEDAARKGEELTRKAFQEQPFGCQGKLAEKRARRDPFAVGPPDSSRCPAMRGLLTYCAPRPYNGIVPWARPVSSRKNLTPL